MQRLGISFQALNKIDCHQSFSLNCIAQIGVDILRQLENLHEKGYLHLDINIGNILVRYSIARGNKMLRRRDLTKNVYLVDFGCSQKYLLPDGKTHRTKEKVSQVMGRRPFLSLNALQFQTQSRKDDLTSLLFTLIMLRKNNRLTDMDKIGNSLSELC